MLGDDLSAALVELRAHAESMMRDTCTITRAGERGAWDEATGTYAENTPVPIYNGKCRVRNAAANPQLADAGEAAWSADLVYIHLPVDSSSAVRTGDLVVITASAHDSGRVGLSAYVSGEHVQTMSTARRLPCRVVTRDA